MFYIETDKAYNSEVIDTVYLPLLGTADLSGAESCSAKTPRSVLVGSGRDSFGCCLDRGILPCEFLMANLYE